MCFGYNWVGKMTEVNPEVIRKLHLSQHEQNEQLSGTLDFLDFPVDSSKWSTVPRLNIVS